MRSISPNAEAARSFLEAWDRLEPVAREWSQRDPTELKLVLKRSGRKPAATPQQILAAYSSGMTMHEVAAHLRTSLVTIRGALLAHGAMRKQGQHSKPKKPVTANQSLP
jgi:hypothetical protein